MSSDSCSRISESATPLSGPRRSNLIQDTLVKLKAVYTLVEQLYTGAQRTPATISPTNQGPNLLSDVFKKLSILTTRFQEIKRSCARAGAVTSLSCAKAWVPELDPADVASGYPSLKEDGTSFDQQDFASCVKEIHPHATIIAEETNLTKYQLGYDEDNQKMQTPSYKEMDLIPLIRPNPTSRRWRRKKNHKG